MPRRHSASPRPHERPALRRCWSCNAVLARHDRHCPRCGESVPFDRIGTTTPPSARGPVQA